MSAAITDAVLRIVRFVEREPWHAIHVGLANERSILDEDPAEAGEQLARYLHHPAVAVRRYCAHLIASKAARAPELLFSWIDDADAQVRITACDAIAKRASEATPVVRADVIAALRPLLHDGALLILTDALKALAKLEDPALPLLLASMLPDPDRDRESRIFGALTDIPGALDVIAGLARGPHANLRGRACTAMGWIKGERELIVETIVVALDDPDPHVRAAAAATAGRVGIVEAEDSLLALGAVEALGMIRSERGLPLVLAVALATGPDQMRVMRLLRGYTSRAEIDEPMLAIMTDRTADLFLRLEAAEVLLATGRSSCLRRVQNFVHRDATPLGSGLRRPLHLKLTAALARWRGAAE